MTSNLLFKMMIYWKIKIIELDEGGKEKIILI
jgi:hypothetical protein